MNRRAFLLGATALAVAPTLPAVSKPLMFEDIELVFDYPSIREKFLIDLCRQYESALFYGCTADTVGEFGGLFFSQTPSGIFQYTMSRT